MDMSFHFRARDAAAQGRAAAPAAARDERVTPWLVAEILADLAEERAKRELSSS